MFGLFGLKHIKLRYLVHKFRKSFNLLVQGNLHHRDQKFISKFTAKCAALPFPVIGQDHTDLALKVQAYTKFKPYLIMLLFIAHNISYCILIQYCYNPGMYCLLTRSQKELLTWRPSSSSSSSS